MDFLIVQMEVMKKIANLTVTAAEHLLIANPAPVQSDVMEFVSAMMMLMSKTARKVTNITIPSRI